MTEPPVIVIAAGGTGGHTFPACALAGALHEMGWQVLFVTDARSASRLVVPEGVQCWQISAASPSGGLVKMLKGGLKLLKGWWQVRALFRREKPGLVVGFGGYPSFPPVLAAIQMRIPTVIHEQNAVAGRANKALGGRVTRVALTYPETQGFSVTACSHSIVTGLPVRPEIAAVGRATYPALQEGKPLHLLVTGGSLGATVFSEVVPMAVARLPEAMQRRLCIVQQARVADIDEARAAYKKTVASVELATFFEDMPQRLATAQLVICRAGASTLAELQAAGRPAVLVPYPSAADDHQTRNAEALERIGGGWLMPQETFTPEALAGQIEHLVKHSGDLVQAAEAGRRHSIGNALEKLVKLCEQLTE